MPLTDSEFEQWARLGAVFPAFVDVAHPLFPREALEFAAPAVGVDLAAIREAQRLDREMGRDLSEEKTKMVEQLRSIAETMLVSNVALIVAIAEGECVYDEDRQAAVEKLRVISPRVSELASPAGSQACGLIERVGIYCLPAEPGSQPEGASP